MHKTGISAAIAQLVLGAPAPLPAGQVLRRWVWRRAGNAVICCVPWDDLSDAQFPTLYKEGY